MVPVLWVFRDRAKPWPLGLVSITVRKDSKVNQTEMRKSAIKGARDKWKEAPAHIRIMAAAYVEPLLFCLEAIGAELDTVCIDLEAIGQALPVEGVRCHGDQCAAGQLPCPTPGACGVNNAS